MEYIKLICDYCGAIFRVENEHKHPHSIKEIRCNWCPNCEDHANDVYEERLIYRKNTQTNEYQSQDQNQLTLF
jgi:hypothetical protein